MENIVKSDFFDRVLEVLKNARKQAKMALNISMVYSYYGVGRMIVEEEQNGEQRAEYGKAILKELSKRLTESLGKGFSVENLKLMRRFYVVYSQDQIGQKVSTQFENLPVTDENPTIGILLCKNKNDAVVEMTLPEDNSQIFASKYLTVLLSKEELKKLMESEE